MYHPPMRTPAQRKLAAYKAEHDLTHEALAGRVAASRADLGDCKARTVQDLLRGARLPSIAMAVKIEALVGISATDWIPAP